MKKYILFAVIALLGICMFGCQKKEVVTQIGQEPLSIEALSTQDMPQSAGAGATESGIAVTQTVPPPPFEPKLESLPPPGPYKPGVREIQMALKNAGYYTGEVDGIKGPLTKRAIEEFQKANGLEADGKVGPKTWAVLGKYVNIPAPATKNKR